MTIGGKCQPATSHKQTLASAPTASFQVYDICCTGGETSQLLHQEPGKAPVHSTVCCGMSVCLGYGLCLSMYLIHCNEIDLELRTGLHRLSKVCS